MKLACIHCGKQFTVSAQQLGGQGRCPHCQQTVHLPSAEEQAEKAWEETQPGSFLENSISALVSVVFHALLVLVLALVTLDRYGGQGVGGEEVRIGILPSEVLSNHRSEDLDALDQVNNPNRPSELDESLEVKPPVQATDPATTDPLALSNLSPSAGSGEAFDLGAVAIGGGGDMGGGDWDGMIQRLRRDGLDIVITFDSTGSMSGEIDQVKNQVRRIGQTLMELVPKTRLGICTYRDKNDQYVVKGLPLTSDLQEVEAYLAEIYAGGGGDAPEAVHEGLAYTVNNNDFRPRARKVILVFGDAPPHQEYLQKCLEIASDFNRQNAGLVSTVSCRGQSRLSEFIEIAQAGGGEAFLTSDERQIMTQLMVLVFGSRYREKVLDAFKLLGSSPPAA